MTARLIFLLIIFIINGFYYLLNKNPISLFLEISIFLMIFLGLISALYGRHTISRRAGTWDIIFPRDMVEFGQKTNFFLKLDKAFPYLFSVFVSLRHNIPRHAPRYPVRESFELVNPKLAATGLTFLQPGFYTFPTIYLAANDFMGLFRFSNKRLMTGYYREVPSLIVLPAGIKDSPGFTGQNDFVTPSRKEDLLREQEMTFLDNKVYEPTDDARRIIWKRYARSNILTVHIPEDRQSIIPSVTVQIDNGLAPDKYRYRIPGMGRYLALWHWQRIKSRAALRIYRFWRRNIPVRIQVAEKGPGAPGSQDIVEPGNIIHLKKTLQAVYEAPLPGIRPQRNGHTGINPRAGFIDQNTWLVSGNSAARADDFVPIWDWVDFKGSRISGSKKLQRVFFHQASDSGRGIFPLLFRILLIFLKVKDNRS